MVVIEVVPITETPIESPSDETSPTFSTVNAPAPSSKRKTLLPSDLEVASSFGNVTSNVIDPNKNRPTDLVEVHGNNPFTIFESLDSSSFSVT